MEQGLEQRIRQRAYEIWEALGRPDGDSDQHWLSAEREVLAASVQAVASSTAKKRKSSRKAPRKAKSARAQVRKMAAA
jgi:Protein of unknown function (DUF2934)